MIGRKLIVVVPDTVYCKAGLVSQPLGRRVAQVAHAVSKVRVNELAHVVRQLVGCVSKLEFDQQTMWARIKKVISILTATFAPITTIVLSCRDFNELLHIIRLLDSSGISYECFLDTDQPDYGSLDEQVITALCTYPVTDEQVEGITDYLPLLSR